MRNFVFVLLFLSCLVFTAVNYRFKNSQLIITGLEAYDQVELEFEGKKVTLPASQLSIPWRKNYSTTLILTPIKDGARASAIRLYIDASRDRPPSVKLKVPSYVPLTKLMLELSVEDDWDETNTLRYSVYLDGARIDPPKRNILELDTFFMHSGERRLRIVCRDSDNNVVDQTYRFVVVPLLPASPQIVNGKIVSNRVHRVYFVEDGTIANQDTRSSELADQFVFVCDLDAAGNESFPALYYKQTEFAKVTNSIIMNFAESCYLPSEHSVFGKIVVPAGQTVVLGPNSTLRINSNCELIVRGTLVLMNGSKIVGQGQLSLLEAGKLVAMGAKIEIDVFVDGATTLWLSDVDLSKANLKITRASLIAMKNVKAPHLILDNVRKLWIDSSEFSNLELSNCSEAILLNSKMSQLKVLANSRARLYSCSIYSAKTAVTVSDLSVLETVDSWISGKTGVSVENFSLFRTRSTQINADTAISASNYSVVHSFAAVIAGTRALQLRDSKFVSLKTQVLGEAIKFGSTEIITM